MRFGWQGVRPGVVLFDLGGVVVDVLLAHSPFFDSGLKADMDVGRVSAEDALALVGEPERVLAEWNRMLRVRSDVVSLIRRLSTDVRCAVLSNTDPLHAAWTEANTGLTDVVSSWTYSFQLGLLKPDPAIFLATLDRLEVVAPEVVLVDDREENVQAAIDLGMGGVLYTSFDEVVASLRNLGLSA